MKNEMFTLIDCKNDESDARVAFLWRNDPETVAASYVAQPKSWDSFFMEYTECYFAEAGLAPVFVFDGGKPAGFIRFERARPSVLNGETAVEIMINIAPDCRGKGIGAAAVAALKDRFRQRGEMFLLADIRAENAKSRALFEKAGFRPAGERTEYVAKTREKCHIVCYLCKL